MRLLVIDDGDDDELSLVEIEKLRPLFKGDKGDSVKGDKGDSIKGDKGDAGHSPTRDELLKLIRPLIVKGDDGHTPTAEELLKLIKPLIPAPIKGDKGDKGDAARAPTDDELLALIRPLIPLSRKGDPGDKGDKGDSPTQDELISLIKPLIPEPQVLEPIDLEELLPTPPPIQRRPYKVLGYSAKGTLTWLSMPAGGGGGASLVQHQQIIELDQRVSVLEAGGSSGGPFEPLGAVAAHEALVDPHTQYLTAAEANALYDALGAADASMAAHLADPNPHPQYVLHCEFAVGGGPSTTDDLPEGVINLYFTDARVQVHIDAHLSNANPHPQYVLHCELSPPPLTTDDLPEGSTNLYYTDARVEIRIELHETEANPHPQYVMHCQLESFEPLGAAAAAISAHEAAANPHPQYVLHCELPTGGPADTDALPEGVVNLYFTVERAMDAIGLSLEDSPTIHFIYDDPYGAISADLRFPLALPDGGVIAVEGIGLGTNPNTSTPFQIVRDLNQDVRITVQNINLGNNAGARIDMQGDGIEGASLQFFCENNTAGASYELADGGLVKGTGVGGFTVAATDPTASIYFVIGSTYRARITPTGAAIGPNAPAASAALDLQGTTGALLITRLTTAQRNALTPSDGMEIYNTTDAQFQVRENGAWLGLSLAAHLADPNPHPQYVLQCELQPPGAGSLTSGTTTVDFGAFPGKHEATVDVSGQSGLISTTRIWAWIQPIATADHTLDEHVAVSIDVRAYYSADGTLRISGSARPFYNAGPRQDRQAEPARLYGQYTVAWAWTN